MQPMADVEPILLVEDDSGIVHLVEFRLRARNQVVAHVASGQAALEWLTLQRSKLMLLDYSLADTNALNLLIRLDELGMTVPPFIVTTGAGDERVAAEMLRRGARDYVIKDAQFLDNLANAVGRVLRELETEAKLAAAQAAVRRMNEELEQHVAERTAQLTAANVEIARASHLKDQLMATMSHELRTPLTGIIGMADALEIQFSASLTEKHIQYVHAIHTAGHRLLDLVNSMLLYANLQSGNLSLTSELCDLVEVCAVSLAKINASAKEKGLTVRHTLQPRPLLLTIDHESLSRILANLLSNAVKFTPEGGTIGLDVVGDAGQSSLVIAVWDTGIGMSPEDQARLFQPFQQLDSSLARRFVGAGLGLAIVRSLVELLGGAINVVSAVTAGSRFVVTLPWPQTHDAGVQPR